MNDDLSAATEEMADVRVTDLLDDLERQNDRHAALVSQLLALRAAQREWLWELRRSRHAARMAHKRLRADLAVELRELGTCDRLFAAITQRWCDEDERLLAELITELSA